MMIDKFLLTCLLSLAPCGAAVMPLPCVGNSPLSGLIALGSTGCTIGDKLFSGFTLTSSGTLGSLDATAINVLTSTSPQGNEVLTFVGGLTASGGANGGTLLSTIGYNVNTLTGAALIEDLTLGLGPLESTGAGPDTASATEYACIGLNVTCTAQNANFVLNAAPGGSSHLTFSPVNSLSLAKQLTINAAAANLVTVSSMTNEVSQIPEPATLSLCGGGLLGLVFVCRRWRQRRAV